MELIYIAPNQTEIKMDSLNSVLFSYKTPVAAEVAGAFYRTAASWSLLVSDNINEWLDGRDAEEKPQEFFDNILTVYMNPHA